MDDISLNQKVWEFFLSGGIFMLFLAICSFVSISVGIHRIMSLRWGIIVPVELRNNLIRCKKIFTSSLPTAPKNIQTFISTIKKDTSPIGKISKVAISKDFNNKEDALKAAETVAKNQMIKLESGTNVLEVIITIAPLLGLLGTVSGLIKVFSSFSIPTSQADPTIIASGIATALNTTIAGLVVAVISVILHSWIIRRLEYISIKLEVISTNLVNEFYNNKIAEKFLIKESN